MAISKLMKWVDSSEQVKNQSVENAGVAFVKKANERNEFFEKNEQTVIYDEQGKRLTI